jgi:hypothetical protein
MSDFDDLLERLLLEPEFKAALAADPNRVLDGYRLTPEERGVLLAQVSTDVGTGTRVEERISKAGMAGLLSAFSGGGGSSHITAGTSEKGGHGQPSWDIHQKTSDTTKMDGHLKGHEISTKHPVDTKGSGETKQPVGSGETKQPVGSGETKQPLGSGETKQPLGSGETKQPLGTKGSLETKGSPETKGSFETKTPLGAKESLETKGHPDALERTGQRYYDRQGHPLTPQEAAQYQAHHQPVYHHLDSKGHLQTDQQWTRTHPHLDQYQHDYQQGTRYYDENGRPMTPEQASEWEYTHHHPPVYHHLDSNGRLQTDQQWARTHPHLDHYNSAYEHGTRFYDDNGRPLTPEQASQYEAAHNHAPAEHVDGKGRPITKEQWAHLKDGQQ